MLSPLQPSAGIHSPRRKGPTNPAFLPGTIDTGFSLIELMIVVAVVGLISAVAVPSYLRARGVSEAAASVAEALALAKHCAVGMRSSIPMIVEDPRTGSQIVCDGNLPRGFFTRSWNSDATGVRCLDSSASNTNRIAYILVDQAGDVACTFL